MERFNQSINQSVNHFLLTRIHIHATATTTTAKNTTQEFLFRRLTRGDEGRVMTVLDIGGMGLGTLSKDVLDVLRTTSEVSG